MSEIRATTISDLAGTGPATLTKQSAAKAWVNFNGQGTVAIDASFNVSSITDSSTGQYSDNFTSNFSDSNYTVTHGCTFSGGNGLYHSYGDTKIASTCAYRYISTVNAYVDPADVTAVHHGDLA